MEWFLSSAIAETTETVNEVAEAVSGSGGIRIFALVFFGLGIYQVVCGLLTIAGKKIYGSTGKNYEQYTKESVQTAMPMIGLENIFLGVFSCLIGLWDLKIVPEIPLYIAGGAVFVIVLLIAILMGKKLVRKDEKK